MRAVIIGPGRVGCGFAGHLLHDSGWEITLAARDRALIDHFRRVGSYRVLLASAGRRKEVTVGGFDVVWTGDLAAVAEAISKADLVATAVGARSLTQVAPLIACGLARARHAVNVIAFENLLDAGLFLRRAVEAHLPGPRGTEAAGFSGAVVSRMIAHRIGSTAANEPMTFVADPDEEFTVEGPALRAPLPAVRGMVASEHYPAVLLRKLYTFSAGHATTAYLGALKGYHYIHSAIRDPEIRAAVLSAMREGQKGLAALFGAELAGSEQDLRHILERFENAALYDPICRVGRDPRRKLASGERLVGAACLAANAGIEPWNLGLASAAALCFADPNEPRGSSLPASVNRSGVAAALKEVCALDASRGVGRLIADCWRRLAPGWKQGNLLLSLDPCMWAWSAGPAHTSTPGELAA